MQPVIKTTEYRDLYSFLDALIGARQTLDEQEVGDSVVVWSPDTASDLLDDQGKVELVEIYARRLELNISLAAAGNRQLREWGQALGWQVLWNMPGLDEALDTEARAELLPVAC